MYTNRAYLSVVFTCLMSSCHTTIKNSSDLPDPDSIRHIIIDINDKMTAAAEDKVHGAAIYRSFCADTLVAVYDNEFSTSPAAVSGYLFGLCEKPHDYTFMTFDKTALLSYLQRFYEPFDKDTIMHYLRVTKTFVLMGGKWKMVEVCDALQPVNYFKPFSSKNKTSDMSLEGFYKWSDGLVDTLFIRDGRLYSTYADNAPQINFPVNDSVFMMRNDFGRKIFNRDDRGKVISYTYLKSDGQRVRAMKIN